MHLSNGQDDSMVYAARQNALGKVCDPAGMYQPDYAHLRSLKLVLSFAMYTRYPEERVVSSSGTMPEEPGVHFQGLAEGYTMREYLLRRLLLLIPTLLGVTFVVFLMMHFIPGDPITNMMGENYSATDAQKLRHELGLDQPLVMQYGKWLVLLLRGDWGRSILSNRPVLADMVYRLPVSLELLILSLVLSLLIALPAGIIAAVWPNSWKDYSAMMVAMAGVSIPEFFLGVLLFLTFALTLRWLPVAGYVALTESLSGNLSHMLLPVIALGLPRAALLTRLVRASLLEVLRLEYVTTARAKGLSDWVVILHHALKNALIPTVTVIGLQVGFLIGASIVVETLFAMPGIGSFGVDAIIKRDYPQVQAFVLVGALVFVLANLSVDLLYSVIDPRIQYGKEGA
jgi:peptide/nickel transport system permease protein